MPSAPPSALVESDALRITLMRPECCVGEVSGMAISLWLTPMRGALLREATAQLAEAAARHGGPVASLAIYRLDPRFPLVRGFDGNVEELLAALRESRRMMHATAAVLEFDGLVGRTFRSVAGSLTKLVPPPPRVEIFESTVDALRWLVPLTVPGGGLAELPRFLHAARTLAATHALEYPLHPWG